MEELFYKIFRKKTINKIEAKIKLLGVSVNFKVGSFLVYRLVVVIFLFIMTFMFSSYGYILAPVIAILGHFVIEKIFLDNEIKKRSKKLEKEALFPCQRRLYDVPYGEKACRYKRD